MKNLIFILLFAVPVFAQAQIGVNTEEPSQALDVNGQIQVGEDSSAPEENGAIRYNTTEQDFEGYSNGQWNSFTSQARGPIPAGARPIYGAVILRVEDLETFEFEYADGSGSFTTIPAGKHVLITSIIPFNNFGSGAGQPGDRYSIIIGPKNEQNVYPDLNRGLRIEGYRNEMRVFNDPYGLLVVGNGGEIIKAYSSQHSDLVWNVNVKGFLVDELIWD